MRKVFSKFRNACIALLTVTLMASLLAPITVQANDTISVTINGEQVVFEDQTPVIIDGRTLVPVGGVFGALGFTPAWDGPAQTATLTRDNITVVITIGSDVFTTNGTDFTLDVPAQIIEGRTMLPLRAVLESIGIPSENIGWDEATRSITVLTQEEAPAPDPAPAEEDSAPAGEAPATEEEDPAPAEEAPAQAEEAVNTALVGTWDFVFAPGMTMAYYVFNADGTGTMAEMDILWWTSNGQLHICITPELCGTPAGCIAPASWHYTLSGNTLELVSTLTESIAFTYVRG